MNKELFICTPDGIIKLIKFDNVAEHQLIGVDQENRVVIISRFGTLPNDRVTVIILTESGEISIIGTNTTVLVTNNENEATKTGIELSAMRNLLLACEAVKKRRDQND